MDFLLKLYLMAAIACLTGGVSPDVAAPDSNNIKTEFSPDDSAAGAVDTSLDNQNATPLVITNPPPTTAAPTTTTSTTTSTTSSTTTAPPTTPPPTKPPTTTTSTTTTTTSTTTTSTTTTPPPTTTRPTTTTTKMPILTPAPQPNPITQSPGTNPYSPYPPIVYPYPHGYDQHGPNWQGRRFNIPWWMLLLEEV